MRSASSFYKKGIEMTVPNTQHWMFISSQLESLWGWGSCKSYLLGCGISVIHSVVYTTLPFLQGNYQYLYITINQEKPHYFPNLPDDKYLSRLLEQTSG